MELQDYVNFVSFLVPDIAAAAYTYLDLLHPTKTMIETHVSVIYLKRNSSTDPSLNFDVLAIKVFSEVEFDATFFPYSISEALGGQSLTTAMDNFARVPSRFPMDQNCRENDSVVLIYSADLGRITGHVVFRVLDVRRHTLNAVDWKRKAAFGIISRGSWVEQIKRRSKLSALETTLGPKVLGKTIPMTKREWDRWHSTVRSFSLFPGSDGPDPFLV